MRSEIRQWFASHPLALNAAFGVLFANAALYGTGLHPLEIAGSGEGP